MVLTPCWDNCWERTHLNWGTKLFFLHKARGEKSFFDWNVSLLCKWYHSSWSHDSKFLRSGKCSFDSPLPTPNPTRLWENKAQEKKKCLYKTVARNTELNWTEPTDLFFYGPKTSPAQLLRGFLACLLSIPAFYISLLVPRWALHSHIWRSLFFK